MENRKNYTEPILGPVLSARDVNVTYKGRTGLVGAVRGASIQVGAGETVGIVGESGSGKSTLAAACLGMLDSKTQVSGSLQLVGREITGLSPNQWQQIRGLRVGYVGQDPFGALNPVLRVRKHMDEALRSLPAQERRSLTEELLRAVELPPETALAYPHELSGGMRQRVSIAMAIANSPELLIADEPTTALDVTTQAEVLSLMRRLRAEREMAILLISHDLGVIRQVCDRVYVMFRGRVVEYGPVKDVLSMPSHPYTRGLLRCARLERDASGVFYDSGRRSGARGNWDIESTADALPMQRVSEGHYAAQVLNVDIANPSYVGEL